MTRKINPSAISNFNVSKQEMIIFSCVMIVIGVVIVGLSWFFNGGDLGSSPIYLIETSEEIPGEQTMVTIGDIFVRDIGFREATVGWKLSGEAPILIQYGVRRNLLVSRLEAPSRVTNLTINNLFPRTRYFFSITTNPGTTIANTSPTYSFVTTAE